MSICPSGGLPLKELKLVLSQSLSSPPFSVGGHKHCYILTNKNLECPVQFEFPMNKILVYSNYCMRHTCVKRVFIVHLKFQLHWMSYILPGNPLEIVRSGTSTYDSEMEAVGARCQTHYSRPELPTSGSFPEKNITFYIATSIYRVGQSRFTVTHMEKDMQVMIITIVLLTLCFMQSQV